MYKKTVLKNNLTLVTHNMSGAYSVCIGVWLKVGSRYEQDRFAGISHFLEHMIFKGSKKYDNESIKRQIEGSGGILNGFTSEELTCYLAKVPKKRAYPTFKILLDMAFNPLLKPQDTQKERTVIIEEIKMYNDLPRHIAQDLLEKIMHPNHPLGRNIAGTVETVSSVSKDDLANFQKKYYEPENMIVVFAGNISHKVCLEFVKKAFGNSKAQDTNFSFEKFNSQQNKTEIETLNKDIEQTRLSIGFPAYSKTHPKRFILNLISVLLGENMSSRLFDEIREKRGLAYEISSYYKPLVDTGDFCIRAGLDNKKVDLAIELILKELFKIKNELVPESELKRAKEYALGHLAMQLEDTLEHMVFLGYSAAAHDKIMDYEQIKKEVLKIKPKDLKEVAKDIFRREKLSIALVGPVKDFDKDKCLNYASSILE
ncbi:MAG: pitrilysin family protein [Candidatus Omnitrophota bacterium]